MPYGSAFIFLLSFEIHRADSLRSPEETDVDGRRVVVFPPFRNGEGLRLRRHLDNNALPYRPGTATPSARLPELKVTASPVWGVPYTLADGIRIDVQGLGEGDDSVADAIGRRLMRLMRLVTRQWWILRGSSESLAPLQNRFPIDGWGQPVGGTLDKTQHIIPWLRSETLLDSNALRIACAHLSAGADSPVSCSTLFDAVFAMSHGDKDQAVLLAAIAAEALIAEQSFAAVEKGLADRKTARRVAKIGDLRTRVDKGLFELLGRSFAAERPDAAERLGRIWIARHALAHGSPRQHARNTVLHDQHVFANAMSGIFELFQWVACLWPRLVPDPMSLMTRPLTPAA